MFQLNTGSAGPFRMMDQVGLDVVLDIEEHYCAEHPEYPEGPRRLLRSYLNQGRLGVKSGDSSDWSRKARFITFPSDYG
jgi:3-hydroxybutyryl-CoA dehydrogenase